MVFCKSENRLLKFFPKIYFLIFENVKNHVTLILKFQIWFSCKLISKLRIKVTWFFAKPKIKKYILGKILKVDF